MSNTNTSGGGFNTLGLNGTYPLNPYQCKPTITVMGEGFDLTDFEALEKKAKRKLITQTMAQALMEIAKSHKDWKWYYRFENTYNCQSEMVTAGFRSYAPYCGNRCCTICLAIRKAIIIQRYLHIIENWEDPYFLTITLQSVNKRGLKRRVDEIAKAIRTILARYKKRHQRGKEQKFYGIWVLESNFNNNKKTYNPHLHLILPNVYQSDTIMQEWLAYWRVKGVKISEGAQKHRPLKTNRKKDLMEVVKYGSKIFTEPDLILRLKEKRKDKKPSFIYAAALYNILRAMDGKDVFNTFGFKLDKVDKRLKKSTNVEDYTNWDYNLEGPDWFTNEYKQYLTDYKVPVDLRELLDNRIDTDLE